MLAKGAYVGIAQDLVDFPFTRALGISSYPYFGHSDPDEIPADYYTRLRGKTGLPVIVTEGGWVSKSFGPIKSNPSSRPATSPATPTCSTASARSVGSSCNLPSSTSNRSPARCPISCHCSPRSR
jgi:hypothetical protein